VRRLQVLAAGHAGPVFVCRPSTAAQESSAAPLRLLARVGPDWTLQVDVFKRQGPPLLEPLRLPAVPAGLQAILTPRLRQPSALRAGDGPGPHLPYLAPHHTGPRQPTETDHALVRTPAAPPQRRVTAH
jgi:protein ImuA